MVLDLSFGFFCGFVRGCFWFSGIGRGFVLLFYDNWRCVVFIILFWDLSGELDGVFWVWVIEKERGNEG